MKKLLFFVCLLIAGAAYAQNEYHPITDGSVWSYSNEKYKASGDTVFESKTYLKIYRQVCYQPFEFNLSESQYFTAIRNDIEARKVFAYLPAGSTIRDINGPFGAPCLASRNPRHLQPLCGDGSPASDRLV